MIPTLKLASFPTSVILTARAGGTARMEATA